MSDLSGRADAIMFGAWLTMISRMGRNPKYFCGDNPNVYIIYIFFLEYMIYI